MAQSDPELLARNDGQMVNVLIKYDLDPVASFQGGKGMAATSPSITGKPLKDGGAAVSAYSGYLSNQARRIDGRIAASVGRADLGRNFLTVFGGVAARIPANTAKDVARVEGVAAVMYDYVAQPQTDASPEFIGATTSGPASVATRRPARASRSAFSTPASGPSIRRSLIPASAIQAARTRASSETRATPDDPTSLATTS